MDEQADMIGDWGLPSPSLSPKAFLPSFLKEDVQFSFGPMRQIPSEDRDDKQGDFSFDNNMSFRPLPEHNSSSGGGLAARIAARAGFSAPCLNTESIRSKSYRSSVIKIKSHYLTIPSGISPTALLDSPVFIANSQTQISPTTGKFQLFSDENDKGCSMGTNGVSKDSNFGNVNDLSSFALEPHIEPAVPFSLSSAYSTSQAINHQELSGTVVSVTTKNVPDNFGQSQVHSHESLSKSLADKESRDQIAGSELTSLDTISGTAEHSPPLGDQQDDGGDHNLTISANSISGGNAGGVIAEDGYHWRKYGQKQVKGSEFPRSYYRCTHMNCPVKKKIESSPEGIVTDIIYIGTHNHPKRASNRASSMAYSQFDNNHGQVVPENGGSDRGLVGGATHNGLLGTHSWRSSSFEQNSMSLMNSEIRHQLSSVQMQNGILESGDSVVGSSTHSNVDGQNGCGSISNEEGFESESKRRKTETFVAELGSGVTRAICEPRVMVQTMSDVDILDDGYRWRKYGQKVVKGNSNPRSYYKCTYIGCTVRKHVERASNDHRSVITTYEGKHNHDVPAARNSSHTNSPISAGFTSLPQNFTPTQPPHPSSLNMPMMQPPALPPPRHGFPMGMNQSNLAGFGSGQNKFLSRPAAHPYPMPQQPHPRHMNGGMGLMPRGDANFTPHLYISNGSSGYHQVSNRLHASF